MSEQCKHKSNIFTAQIKRENKGKILESQKYASKNIFSMNFFKNKISTKDAQNPKNDMLKGKKNRRTIFDHDDQKEKKRIDLQYEQDYSERLRTQIRSLYKPQDTLKTPMKHKKPIECLISTQLKYPKDLDIFKVNSAKINKFSQASTQESCQKLTSSQLETDQESYFKSRK